MKSLPKLRKRWAAYFCGAVVTFAIGIGVHSLLLNRQSTTAVTAYARPEAGSLRARILEAQANGNKTVELGVLACGWDTGDLNDALSRDTIVLADLVGKKTYEESHGLFTWYKFKIKETLVSNTPPRHDFLYSDAPSDMLPIAQDEFLIQEMNGAMDIDGVTVIQRSNGAVYLGNQTYLLFVWIDPSKRTAVRSGTDPLGVFIVDDEEKISSYSKMNYPLKADLARRFNNSVNNMRQALKK